MNKLSVTRRVGSIARMLRERRWRGRLENRGFSIISQNCIGGCIYHDLGMRFLTPTVDLLVCGEDFVKLVENLEAYLTLEAVPAGAGSLDGGTAHPMVSVGDLTVHAIHYASDVEAADAWNRRRTRVDLGNAYVIACMWDLGGDVSLAERLAGCGYPVAIFSDDALDVDGAVRIPERIRVTNDRGERVRPALTAFDDWGERYFEKFFDFVGWLNGDA